MSQDDSNKTDKLLWQNYQQGIKPLKRRNTKTPTTETREKPMAPRTPQEKPLSFPLDCIPPQVTEPRHHPNISRKKRRALVPQAQIDLHGLTLDQGFHGLSRFILSSVDAGHRVVLVITGKGKIQDEGAPKSLRACLPLWVRTPPLCDLVTNITHARPEHGAEGSFYVMLRKSPGVKGK